jgi:sugar-specific transcriptional regulator TrmB
MTENHLATLAKFGLSTAEAQIYLSLARNAAPMKASAIVTTTGVPRGSVYPALNSLADRGIVQNGAGYGSEFTALSPQKALPRLIAAEKKRISEAESLTSSLIKEIQPSADKKQNGSEEKLIEVLRDPQIRGERFQQLQREAQSEVNTLASVASVPLQQRRAGNPALCGSLRRGIPHRVIYEPAMLEHEYIAPFLHKWIKLGEEARLYKGHLPLKFALFDNRIAWMPLEVNAAPHPVISLVVRHEAMGQTLRLLFDHLWSQSEPLLLGSARRVRRRRKQT